MLGTSGNDRLTGTPLGDNLFGLQGNDILKGCGAMIACSAASDPIASPARRATTACSGTTAAGRRRQ